MKLSTVINCIRLLLIYDSKAKFSLGLTKYSAMNTHGCVEVYINAFVTLALDGGEWSASRHGRFTPGGTAPRTQWVVG
jgi:hypothetical protein